MAAAGPLSKIPGVRVISLTPPALPGGGDFPVDLVISSTAEPDRLAALAGQLVGKAFGSGLFMYADADLKFDQPQAEVVFDRDKVRAQGVNLSDAGRDLSTMLGGNYVNRFSIQGRSYKVIPQVKRAERLTPDQLEQIHVTGADGRLVPLSTFATLKTTTEPRELKRFQQLNAVRIQGVIPPGVSLDKALRFLEDEAAKVLPNGFTLDYAGESRQLRTEGGKFLGTFLLSAILIYLVLAAQFESFRDPFIILAGSVPLALSGGPPLLVPLPHVPQHLQPGRPHHARRPRRQERHPDRRVRQHAPGEGGRQGDGRRRGREHAAPAGPDDDRGDDHGPPASRLRARPRRGSAELDRHHARDGDVHRDRVHAPRRPVDLRPRGEDARCDRTRGGGRGNGRAGDGRGGPRAGVTREGLPAGAGRQPP